MEITEATKIKTVADQIAEILRRDIFSGKLSPGSRLKEKEISQLLNVSRTPIREAFRILESDGLVEIHPNKGVLIPRIEREDLDEVCELRILVEVYCIRKFIKIMDEHNLQEMEDLLRKMEDALDQKNYLSYCECCTSFHGYYISNSGNKRLYSVFSRARDIMVLNWCEMNLQEESEFYRKVLNDRRKILEALRERNPDKCEKLLRDLLESNCQIMKRKLGMDM